MSSTSRTLQILKYSIKRSIPIELWSSLGKLKRKRNIKIFGETEYYPKNYIYEEKVFIIRRQPPGAGLFSNVNHVLQGIIRSRELDAVPVVDMQNYWTTDSQRRRFLDSKNAWEYFFEPLGGLLLNDAYKSERVILSSGNRILKDHYLSDKGLRFVYNSKKVESVSKIYLDHIQLNAFSLDLLRNVKEAIGWDPDNTLGCSFRGTHYTTLEPKGHPRQPSQSDFIKMVSEVSEKQEFPKLFVASDEHGMREKIQMRTKAQVYQEIRSYDFLWKFFKNGSQSKKVDQNLVHTFGYLLETYLLSETKSIVSTVANGSSIAIIINGNKYTNPYIFDLSSY